MHHERHANAATRHHVLNCGRHDMSRPPGDSAPKEGEETAHPPALRAPPVGGSGGGKPRAPLVAPPRRGFHPPPVSAVAAGSAGGPRSGSCWG